MIFFYEFLLYNIRVEEDFMIKLFACDLDGTLLNDEHEFDEIIFNAIDEVIKEGKYFSFATGRHMHAQQIKILKYEKRDVFMVCMNGALILDPSQNIIYDRKMDKKIVKDLLETFPEIDFDCIGKDHVFIRANRQEHLDQFSRSSIWNRAANKWKIEDFIKDSIFDQSIDDILSHDIYKINCRLSDAKTIEKMNCYLDQHKDEIVNAPYDNGAFEITGKDVNKGNAVAWLCEYLHLQEDEVAVYGDGGNDIEMLERFKHSYGMSNGMESAKKAANEIIGCCKDYAVSKHILETLQKEKDNK